MAVESLENMDIEDLKLCARTTSNIRTLRRILRDVEDANVWCALAQNQHMPTELLDILLHKMSQVTECIHNMFSLHRLNGFEPAVIIEAYQHLISHINMNENLMRQIIYAAGDNYDVARFIVRSPKAPSDYLEKIALYGSRDLRCGVAGNFKTSKDTLIMLCHDLDEYVRKAVAESSDTPRDLLKYLSLHDDSPFVRLSAIRTLGN